MTSVDRLNIIAHDKFQEIIDEANKPDSAIHLQQVILNNDQIQQKTVTVVSQSQLANRLGIQPEQTTSSTQVPQANEKPQFSSPQEQKVAQITYEVIKKLENQPEKVPTSAFLQNPQVRAEVIATVKAQYHPLQGELEGITPVDVEAVVAKTTELVMLGTIDIPRILVLPRGEVRSGFNSFQLQLSSVKYQPPSEDLWIQHLRTHQLEVLSVGQGGIEEDRLEDYVVSGLVDFDDVSYDDNAELLYDLAGQVVEHFRSYLSENDTRKVLQVYQRQIADFIHVQMQTHYWEQAVDYEVKISKGFSELKPSAYTAVA